MPGYKSVVIDLQDPPCGIISRTGGTGVDEGDVSQPFTYRDVRMSENGNRSACFSCGITQPVQITVLNSQSMSVGDIDFYTGNIHRAGKPRDLQRVGSGLLWVSENTATFTMDILLLIS